MPNTTYGTPYAQSSDLVSNWPGVSSNVADRIDDVSFKGNGLNDQTGTSYTLVLTDAGKTVTLSNASAVTVTIPTNASVAYETGTVIEFTNKGAGLVTISPAGGVTLNNAVTLGQYSSALIKKVDTNTWIMASSAAQGLNLIVASAFTTANQVNVNNCFSSTFDNYRIILDISAASTSLTVSMRLRVSGSDNSTSNYTRQNFNATSTTVSASQTANAAQWGIATNDATYMPYNRFVYDIMGPQLTRITTMNTVGMYVTSTPSYLANQDAYLFNQTTSFDGFSLLTSTGTISGSVRIYGYRNS